MAIDVNVQYNGGLLPDIILFRKPFTTLFHASWLSFEAFNSLMRIEFMYYNCLGFGLVLWLQNDFIPNTV